ncbi:sulfotransferase family protein [Roseivivax halodurans]|uniref:sulfotransferase family protein n=1 Tax=Roseivivax halodurans TaxID=93683 RepID=UPI0004B98F1D|nr:sulfotransferase [Roseivivax halodurans]
MPDFIIGGAPKCGTTSLHFILAQSREVGLPEDEVHFFDADDPIAHPDFLFDEAGKLNWYDPRPGNPEGLDWYASRFAELAGTRVVGEDSTVYLQSEVAAKRIHETLPDVRLIFMLRDPVARAYSQYWHLVTRGRASCRFETALTRHPSIILGSTYAPHLRRYLEMFGPERVMVGLFEDFLADRQGVVDRAARFIDITPFTVAEDKAWFNRTYYPSRPIVQYAINTVSSQIVRHQYRNHFGARHGGAERLRNKIHYYWFRYIHPLVLTSPKKPPMCPKTRAYLEQHLSARNQGLSELLGRDLSTVWPGFSA